MMVDSDSDDDCCLLIEPETTESDDDVQGQGPINAIQATTTTTTTTTTASHFNYHGDDRINDDDDDDDDDEDDDEDTPFHDERSASRPLVRSDGARRSSAPRYPRSVGRAAGSRADVEDVEDDDLVDDLAESSAPEAALSHGDMSAVFKAMISEEVWGSNYTVLVRWLRHGARSTFIKFWLVIILILLCSFISIHIYQSGSAVKTRHSPSDGPSTSAVYQEFVLNHMHWEFEPRVDVGTRSTVTFEIDYEWCYSYDFSQAYGIPFAAFAFFQWCESPTPERNLTEEVVIQTFNELASSNHDLYAFFYWTNVWSGAPLVILALLARPALRSKYPSELLSAIAGVLPKGSMMVSYRHADFAAELARRIPRLFPKGICWLDKDALLEGINLPKTISTAAANAEIGFVMLSKSYLQSQNCCYELLSFEPRLEPLFMKYPDLYHIIHRGQDVDEHDSELEGGAVRLNLNYLVPRKPRLNHNAAGNGLTQQPFDENHCAKLVVYCLEEPIIRERGYRPNTAREKKFVAAAIKKLKKLGHEVVMLRHPENDRPDDHDVRRFNWANSYHAQTYASFSPGIYDDPRKANIFMRGVRSFFAIPSVHQDTIAREILTRLCPTGILRHALRAHQRVPPIDKTWRQLAAYSTDRTKSLNRTEVRKFKVAGGLLVLNQLAMVVILATSGVPSEQSLFPYSLVCLVTIIGLLLTAFALVVCKTSWTSTHPSSTFPRHLPMHCLIVCNKLGLARVVNVYYSTHGVPDSFVLQLKYLHEIGVINLDSHLHGDDVSSSSTSSPVSGNQSDENPSFSIISLEGGDGNLHVETVSSIDPEASAFYFAPNHTFDVVAFVASAVNRHLGDVFIQTRPPDPKFDGMHGRFCLKEDAVAVQLLKVSLGLDRGAS